MTCQLWDDIGTLASSRVRLAVYHPAEFGYAHVPRLIRYQMIQANIVPEFGC
jgi:hypothetical protein